MRRFARNYRGELPTIPLGRLTGSGSPRVALLLVVRDGAFSAACRPERWSPWATRTWSWFPPGFRHLQVRGEFKSFPWLRKGPRLEREEPFRGSGFRKKLLKRLVLLRSSGSTAVKPGDYSSQEFFVSRQTIILRTRWKRRLPGDPERTCSRPLPPSDAAR